MPRRAPLLLALTALLGTAAPASATEWVELTASGLQPPVVRIEAGETVHFSAKTGAPWTVTDHAGRFASGTVPPRGEFSMTLSVPGTHRYDAGGRTGTIVVRGRELPGAPADDAGARLPDVTFPPVDPDTVATDPRTGVEASTSRILVGLATGATVAQVNAALEQADVRILGGDPRLGTLLVETASAGWWGGFGELTTALEALRGAPGIAFAAMSTVVKPTAVPRRPGDDVPSWSWGEPLGSGNRWLATGRFPQAWNLLEALRRKRPNGVTGVVDTGFAAHADLPGLDIRPQVCAAGGECRAIASAPDPHGNHVAGIIGADFDNDGGAGRSKGTSGGNPLAKVAAWSSAGFAGSAGGLGDTEGVTVSDQQLQLLGLVLQDHPAPMRVLNHSMSGIAFDPGAWAQAAGQETCGPGTRDDDLPLLLDVCTPDNHDAFQLELANLGLAAARVAREAARRGILLVQAAGDQGAALGVPVSASASSELGWVAAHWEDPAVGDGGANPVVTVGSVGPGGGRSAFSPVGADISAPGEGVVSTVLDHGYGELTGTSQAAAQVTAAAGLVVVDEPGIGLGRLRERLLAYGGGRQGGGQLAFDYTIPDRVNLDADGDGVVDVPRTTAQVAPDRWRVDLDACGASMPGGGAIVTYAWAAEGEAIGSGAGCRLRWRPDREGFFDVTLTATGADGQTATASRTIEVQDFLIMSMGDSIASGEGNPDVPSPLGWTSSRWQEPRCHRSAFAGPAQAARTLEALDDQSSITFVHVACSGARMAGDTAGTWNSESGEHPNPVQDGLGPLKTDDLGIGGLLTPYEGIKDKLPPAVACLASGRSDLTTCHPPQLDQLKALTGTREPDALLVSIGANDMTFSKILMDCMFDVLSPLTNCTESRGGEGVFLDRIALLPRRYARLNARIRELWPDMDPSRVIITQYPDLTIDEHGQVNLSCGIATGIRQVEAQWAHETVVPALNAAVATAAATHGWTLATGIPNAFHGHGYCADDEAWIVGVIESFSEQDGKDGGFHPNYAGHEVYATSIRQALRSQLDLPPGRPGGPPKDRATTLDAFRTLAAGVPPSRWADLNDPSLDGNRRVERTVQPDGTVTERSDVRRGLGEGERSAPDGRVDMRDLRRFRDAWLQACLAGGDSCPAPADIELDGGAQHPKRDLDLDGCVAGGETACGGTETRFARADLNGDGRLDPARKAAVPWQADGAVAASPGAGTAMSDTEVLQAAWTGGKGAEGWAKADVPDLLRSGDVEVHADAVLDAGAREAVVQAHAVGGGPIGPERRVRRADGVVVMTVPAQPGQQLELVARSQSADGEMTSHSAPFTLRHGEDEAVAVCPDLTVRASRHRVPSDGRSTSIITARVGRCSGREVAGHTASFTLDAPGSGGASVAPVVPVTDADGRATARFTAGTISSDAVVRVSVDLEDGGEPLTASLDLTTIPELHIKYLWSQEIDQWKDTGTTKWAPFPGRPNCREILFTYCIEAFDVHLDDQRPGGIKRAGTLTGGGDRFSLTEEVRDSTAGSRGDWILTDPAGQKPPEAGHMDATWFVDSSAQTYTDHELTAVSADEQDGGTLRVSGLQAVGDLPYTYTLLGSGTQAPVETHAASTAYLLVPPGEGRIRFAAQPTEDLVFGRDQDGRFKAFRSCGLTEDHTPTPPGYFVPGTNPYIPGALSVGRKTSYLPGDRPVPAGTHDLKITYKFAAVAWYEGQPVPAAPSVDFTCSATSGPTAAFDVDPAGDGPAKEGRTVTFHGRSTDPDNDIVHSEWDFGDGTTGVGHDGHHLFEDDGEYTVELTVRDAKGNTDTETATVVVQNEAPEAEIDDAAGTADRVVVDYRMLDPGHEDKEDLAWTLTSTNPAWTPQQGSDHAGVWWRGPFTGLPAGTYPLTLTVSDDDGATATAQAVLTITGTPPEPQPQPVPVSFRTCDPAVTLDREERDFLDLVNAYREENGLQPVEVSATLTRAADLHAQDMAARDYMAHEGQGGSSPADRAWGKGYPRSASVGENLAESETAHDAQWAWRGSTTGHNENLLNPAWRAVGISRERSAGGTWRWATSYGTAQDCPAAVAPERVPSAPLQLTATPGGVEPAGEEGVVDAARLDAAAPAEEEGPAPRLLTALEPEAGAAAEVAPRWWAPTVAVTVPEPAARATRPYPITNRSRDADGTPVAASIDPGDGSGAKVVAPDAVLDHVFAETCCWEWYTLRASATDEGRKGELQRSMRVYTDDPPDLVFKASDRPAAAGKPYLVELDVLDPHDGGRLEGIEVTLQADGGPATKATSDALGRIKATVTLGPEPGFRQIAATFAGNARYRATTTPEHHGVHAFADRAPVAKAGGPYVVGEGRSLLLNGSRSSDPDVGDWSLPGNFDKLASFRWDLDLDGQFDDASGRLPSAMAWEQVEAVMCPPAGCVFDTEHTIRLEVADSWGEKAVSEAKVRFAKDFELSLGGGGLTVTRDTPGIYAVTVVGSASFKEPVTLEAIDLPQNIQATFGPNPITPPGIATMTLTATGPVSASLTDIKVRGTSGTIVREVGGDLTVGTIGLVPVCKGGFSGTLTDTAGAPVADAKVTGPVTSVFTDETGRWVMEDIPLGWLNAPLEHTLTFSKDGFWGSTKSGTAGCGSVPDLEATVMAVGKGKVKALVIDQATKLPMKGAIVTERVCNGLGGCTWVKLTESDAKGEWTHEPTLGYNNTATTWQPTVDFPGYWYDSHPVDVEPGVVTQAQFELIKKCNGTVGGGTVLDITTKKPVPGAGVGVYLSGGSRPDFTTKTDANGEFVVDREVPLRDHNSPTSIAALPTVPQGSPPGSQGYVGYFVIGSCGERAGVTLYIKRPEQHLGTVEGTVTEQGTNGTPLPGHRVRLCDQGCRSVLTDAQGRYRFEDVHVGYDGTTSRELQVTGEADGFYDGLKDVVVAKGQTAKADFTMLRRKFAQVRVEVTNGVTGAPIPDAEVFEGWDCISFCKDTDRNGVATFKDVALGAANAPRPLDLNVRAFGFWPMARSVALTPDGSFVVKVALQPECEPARVTGRVVDVTTQDPIEGARVDGGPVRVATNADGVFVIDGIKPSTGNTPRKTSIYVSADGYYSQTAEVTIFCGAKLVVDFGTNNTKTGKVVGRVFDEDTGEGIAGAFVGTQWGATATTGAGGAFSFAGVPLGANESARAWQLTATPEGYKPATRTVVVQPDGDTLVELGFTKANAAPAGAAQTVTVAEDDDATPFVLGATDPDAGDVLSTYVLTWPQHGTLTGTAPDLRYEPDPNWHGTDTFTYAVHDGAAQSEAATVTLVTTPVNDAPDADPDELEGLKDQVLRIPKATLLANDEDVDGEPLVIASIEKNHAGAQVEVDGDDIVFTPPPGFSQNGNYAFFSYTLRDAAGATDTVWVYITVRAPAGPPACIDRAFTTPKGTPLTEQLACVDGEEDPMTYEVVTQPSQGTVVLGDDGAFTWAPPAGFVGTTSFTYLARDAGGAGPARTVTLTAVAPNTAPVCQDASAAGAEDAPVDVDVTCTDADGDPVTVELVAAPVAGSAALRPGGFRYTGAKDASGQVTFTFRATDDEGAASPVATATVTLAAVNDVPVCRDVTGASDGSPVDVAPDCSDVEGDALTYEVTSGPATVVGGKLRVAPAEDASGPVAVGYRARDAADASSPATATVTVTRANRAPVCEDASASGFEDAPVDVDVTCTDADGDALTVALVSGSAAERAGGFRFTGPKDASGTFTFTFRARDGKAASAPATATVSLAAVNDVPVCRDVTGASDGSPVDVDPDCSDVEGDALTYEVTSGPATVVGGRLRVAPAEDASGPVTVGYRAKDAGASAPATATVTVTRANRAPVCQDVAASGREDEPVDVDVACTDVDGDALTLELVSGSASKRDGGFRFTGPKDASGQFTFTFRAKDGKAESAPATATVTLAAVNDAPACRDASASGREDEPVDVDVACTDVDGDALTLELVSGSASKRDGGFRFTGPKDASGQFTFTFRAKDGKAESAPATATVTLAAVNDVPVCKDVTGASDGSPVDVDPDCSDVEGDALTYEVTSGPATVVGGKLRVTPAEDDSGPVTVGYRAKDAADASAPATATVTVTRANRAPVCEDASASGFEDQPVDVRVTCTDPDGDALALTGEAPAIEGGFRFTPPRDASGTFAFAFRARDARGSDSAPATATVTIAAVNDVPVCKDVAGASDGSPVDVDPDCSDVEGDALTYEVTSGPATVVGGKLRVTPAQDATGPVAVGYRARDAGVSAPATATVTVTRARVNRAPVPADDDVTRQPSGGVVLVPLADLLRNDADPDGDALRITAVGEGEHVTPALEADAVRVTPEAGYAGIARFRYTVADPSGATAQATAFLRLEAGGTAGEQQQGGPDKPQQGGGTDQLLECAERPVVLEDVVPAGGRVRLLGLVDESLAGRTIVIRRMPGDVVVARPRVGKDGRFSATTTLPRSRDVRYVAQLGTKRSTTLKLWRRMRVDAMKVTAAGVVIAGRVEGPLAKRAADRAIEVREDAICAPGKVVAKVMPDAKGRFRVTVPRAKDATGAVYRLHTKVRATRRSPKLFDTWTLPRAADF